MKSRQLSKTSCPLMTMDKVVEKLDAVSPGTEAAKRLEVVRLIYGLNYGAHSYFCVLTHREQTSFKCRVYEGLCGCEMMK